MYAQADGNELAYWRKHNRLHGWMEELWESKGKPYDGKLEDNPLGDFNWGSPPKPLLQKPLKTKHVY